MDVLSLEIWELMVIKLDIWSCSSDLQIYHDGTNTVIGNTTGNLYILDDNAVILGSNSGTESYFKVSQRRSS